MPGADVRADLIDRVFVSFLRRLAQQPAKLEAVVRAAETASTADSGALETERNRLSRELSASEKDSSTLVNRLADPELADVAAIKKRLTELEQNQRNLAVRITDVTLQIRDRRDQTLSLEEVRGAFAKFDELWDELTFDERQYAVRLLVKQVEMHFEKGNREGEMKIEAWGRSPKPLQVRIRDFRSDRKLRNQVERLPD